VQETLQDTLPDPGIPISRNSRLAVFGGSFDPVHNGHIALAQALVDRGDVVEVLFVPCRRPPHKSTVKLTDGEQRMEMLKLATEPFAAMSVADIELMRVEGHSYTFDTMNMLKQVFPEHELLFLMGMDSLASLHQWHRAPELVERFSILIHPRPGISCPSFAELRGHFGMRNARKLQESVLIDLDLHDISASTIRQTVAKGGDISALCSGAVVEYIAENKLYENEL